LGPTNTTVLPNSISTSSRRLKFLTRRLVSTETMVPRSRPGMRHPAFARRPTPPAAPASGQSPRPGGRGRKWPARRGKSSRGIGAR
jgi:hypothetical protein